MIMIFLCETIIAVVLIGDRSRFTAVMPFGAFPVDGMAVIVVLDVFVTHVVQQFVATLR